MSYASDVAKGSSQPLTFKIDGLHERADKIVGQFMRLGDMTNVQRSHAIFCIDELVMHLNVVREKLNVTVA